MLLQGRGESHVLLDISHKPRHAVLDHFPNVAAHCASLGVDITQVGCMQQRLSGVGFGGGAVRRSRPTATEAAAREEAPRE